MQGLEITHLLVEITAIFGLLQSLRLVTLRFEGQHFNTYILHCCTESWTYANRLTSPLGISKRQSSCIITLTSSSAASTACIMRNGACRSTEKVRRSAPKVLHMPLESILVVPIVMTEDPMLNLWDHHCVILVLSRPGGIHSLRGSLSVATSFIKREEQVGVTSRDEFGRATIDGTIWRHFQLDEARGLGT